MRPSGRRRADRGEAALVNLGRLGNPPGHLAISSDQVRDHRFAKGAVCEHRFDKDRTWHLCEGQVFNRKDVERA